MSGVTNKKAKNDKITLRDLKLLISAGLFLGAVCIKTSSEPWAENIKQKAVSVLNGGVSAEQVVNAFGQTFENGDLQAVFNAFETDKGKEDVAMVYSEAPFEEDLISAREQSNFPKEEDNTAYVMTFNICTPVENGIKTSDFGERIHPIDNEKTFHYGLDIGADKGEPILSFADGTVRESGESKSYGNYIIVDHEQGISTLYAHCSKLIKNKGEKVKAEDKIAEVGATGNATGNHLHFEIWRDGKVLNPSNYILY